MINTNEAQTLLDGGNVIDRDGDKVGEASQVYLDDRTDQPAWVTVTTGLIGNAESFVPLSEATMDGDDVRVPYSTDQIKDAPRVDDDNGRLQRSEEANLYRYYGLSDSDHTSDAQI